MSGNPSTPKPVIKVYAAQHAQHDPVARERMERVVAAFGGVLVGEPSPEYAVWLVADTQLRLHGAIHYRDLEWQDEYVLCCGPNHQILEVPEGAKTIHIPTANNKSIYNDQAIALTLEYLYASS